MHSSHIKAFIAKEDLIDKGIYIGICRNASEATWYKDLNKFVYMRTKFGSVFPEAIQYPGEDTAHDAFYPFKFKEEYGS